MTPVDPREFGLTADDLRALADAFYPDGDERRHKLTTDHGTAVAAGRVRSRVRALADQMEVGDLLHADDGKFGVRPDSASPLPNMADEAWSRIEELRAEARSLGVEVDDRWPIVRLEHEIAARQG